MWRSPKTESESDHLLYGSTCLSVHPDLGLTTRDFDKRPAYDPLVHTKSPRLQALLSAPIFDKWKLYGRSNIVGGMATLNLARRQKAKSPVREEWKCLCGFHIGISSAEWNIWRALGMPSSLERIPPDRK